MLPSFCRDTVTVLRPTLTEKRGTQVLDWTNPTSTVVNGCELQTRTTSRDMDGRALQVTNGAMLYVNPDVSIQAGDRIRHGSTVYEITGEPMAKVGATGRLSHYAIPLSEWKG